MENEINNTQETTLEATHNNEVQAGTHPVTETSEVIKTYSEDEVNAQMKKTRLASEKEAKKQILAQLGLTLDDEDKLQAFKEAYQNSLSDEEKKNQVMEELQADNVRLTASLEEKDYIIKALVQLTGKNEEDVDKIVKMAKGLKTEENTIDEAIKEVIDMLKPVTPNTTVTVDNKSNVDMPVGQAIQQPSTTVSINTQNNPFATGSINFTQQSKLIKENPELAKKLASEAGVKLQI